MSEGDGMDRGRAERAALDEEALRRLLADAGPRPAPPADDLAALAAAARAEWRRRYSGGPARTTAGRRWLPLAAAAVVTAGLGRVW